jgi:hypothetical protein
VRDAPVVVYALRPVPAEIIEDAALAEASIATRTKS